MKEKVLKLALEALWTAATPKAEEAIKAIQEFFSQLEQEPVAYCDIHYLPEPCAQCAKEHEGYNIPPQSSVSEYLKTVAWNGDCVLGHCGSPAGCEASNCCRADYTTPPQRKPLMDEQIDLIGFRVVGKVDCPALSSLVPYGAEIQPVVREIARAIEAAHGIK